MLRAKVIVTPERPYCDTPSVSRPNIYSRGVKNRVDVVNIPAGRISRNYYNWLGAGYYCGHVRADQPET